MSFFDEIEEQYNEIEKYIGIQIFNHKRDNNFTLLSEFERKREINNSAIFLLVFAQFEQLVKMKSSDLIQTKQDSNLSWKEKSVWDILPNKSEKSPRMTFMNRLALLIDISSSEYKLVKEYYNERNNIAHDGKFYSYKVTIPDVFIAFDHFYNLVIS